VENVTDRTSNPFGMRPPCESPCSADVPAVFGYGDANADFHVIGDHPGVHGGRGTGVPFTDTGAGEAIWRLLSETGFANDPDEDGVPDLENCFLSYVHMCCPADGDPTLEAYDDLERFFDAELRAIAAHVLLPVGERATERVIESYTARASKLPIEMAELHASEVRGSGFLVVPIRDPNEWEAVDADRLTERLRSIRARDYRETADLSRFLATDDLYYVR
jgi:uracil-DNA glycosylase family 4